MTNSYNSTHKFTHKNIHLYNNENALNIFLKNNQIDTINTIYTSHNVFLKSLYKTEGIAKCVGYSTSTKYKP